MPVINASSEANEGSSKLGTVAAVMVCSILWLQAAVALWLGLPGQVTVDAVIQLYEGRTHQTISFHPPLMSILLGALDRVGDAPLAFVFISQAMLSWCSWLVLTSEGKQRTWRYLLAAVFLLNPIVLGYVGILWKDVLFAHANILLYLLLARWKSEGVRIGFSRILFLIALLTIVVGMRQQGILFAFAAVCWIAEMMKVSKIRSVLIAIVLFVLPVFLNATLTRLIQAPPPFSMPASQIGLKILMYYDLVGIIANDGKLTENLSNQFSDDLHQQIPLYSSDRVDTLKTSGIHYTYTTGMLAEIWWLSIMKSPDAYLRHRWGVTKAIWGLANMQVCAPFDSGVAGPVTHPLVSQELTSLLGLEIGPNPSTPFVRKQGWKLVNTPLFMHWVYALVLVCVSLVLIFRKAYVLLTLAVCSLLFLLSYAVIGIACDFRYAFTLTEATSLLIAWSVLSPARPVAD